MTCATLELDASEGAGGGLRTWLTTSGLGADVLSSGKSAAFPEKTFYCPIKYQSSLLSHGPATWVS